MINQDFEYESQKDSVYLLEKTIQEEKEFWEWYESQHNRKPAQIVVINESKKEEHEPKESEILPF
jgi:hypothetical protein